MKRVLILLLLATAIQVSSIQVKAQSYFETENIGTFKIGAGNTHDFPGLNGYTIAGEFSKNIADRFQAGFGLKLINLNGYPRTQQVKEYTKAKTIDFNLFYIPFQTETQQFKIGLGYSFSMYNARRSYPISHTPDIPTIDWPVQDLKGRTSGASVLAEYEYTPFESMFTYGIRAAIYKAYDRVFYVGPFVGVRL